VVAQHRGGFGSCPEIGDLIPQVCYFRGMLAYLLDLSYGLQILSHPAQDLLYHHQQFDIFCFCGFSEVCVEIPVDGPLVLYRHQGRLGFL
jgi:hypothetical protein